MTYRSRHINFVFLALLAGSIVSGCATQRAYHDLTPHATPTGLAAIERMDPGAVATWSEVIAAARAADAVILGEQHDDAAGHAIQAAIVDAVFAARPAAALAMEMLDRDDRHILDGYLAGHVALDDFLARSNAGKWTTRDNWLAWYQPMIDAARAGGHDVVAANAPRRLVTLARTGGYGAVEALGELDHAMVALPTEGLDIADYETRFRGLMTGHGAEGMPPLDEETIAGYFRAQRVWDATMADSLAKAVKRSRPVILLVGRFHSDYDGALIQELRARAPKAKILTISIAPKGDDDGESTGRADFVIHSTLMERGDGEANP